MSRELKGEVLKVEMSRKDGRGEVKPGDWPCPECRLNNFARRDTCFRCGCPKPSGYDQYGGGRGGYERRDGNYGFWLISFGFFQHSPNC